MRCVEPGERRRTAGRRVKRLLPLTCEWVPRRGVADNSLHRVLLTFSHPFSYESLGVRGAAIRGGNWNNGADAGRFALNLNNGPLNVNTNIGGRCALSGRGRGDGRSGGSPWARSL